MANKRIKQQVAERLTGVPSVSWEFFRELLAATQASEGYLRRLLRASGLPLDPRVEGILSDNMEQLERTLGALAAIYDSDKTSTRQLVLDSKRHHRMALLRRPADEWRNEVLLHINTWLENPGIYRIWAELERRKRVG